MPTDWATRLMPNEQIRWEGRPRPGLRFGLVDVPITIFGLFFTAISMAIVVATFPFGLLIPHFWIGLYFVGGRLFVDRRIRDSTRYAITDSRAIIVREWPRRKVTTVNLDTVAEINLTEHRDGSGTISFGGTHMPMSTFQAGHRAVPAFQFIDDATAVLALAHDAHGHRSDSQRPASSNRFGPPPPPTLQ